MTPGVITISLVLYKPIPAGFTLFEVISPPNEPIAPPIETYRAVPPGINQAFRKASSGTCAFIVIAAKVVSDKKKNSFFIQAVKVIEYQHNINCEMKL